MKPERTRGCKERVLKTGSVHDDGGDGLYLEYDDWSPWLWHAPEHEFEKYVQVANSLMGRLERLPPAVRRRLNQIAIRCPVNGCKLATVFWIPRAPSQEEIEHERRMAINCSRNEIRNSVGEVVKWKEYLPGHYFYVGRTASGAEVYDIVNYGFNATPRDADRGCICCRVVYWRAGCRHGTATLERNDLLDMFMMAERVHNFYFTEQQAIDQLPDKLRPFWGKRVFHPHVAAWHPKKLTPRTGAGRS